MLTRISSVNVASDQLLVDNSDGLFQWAFAAREFVKGIEKWVGTLPNGSTSWFPVM
jgi:hypothetical protein